MGRMRAGLGLGLALLAWSGAARANPPAPAAAPKAESPVLSTSSDGRTVYLVGEITDGSYLRFARYLRAAPRAAAIYLASPGGLVTEGYLIANLVRTRQLAAHVEHLCASACTMVYAAGTERSLGRDGRLGFHQTFSTDAAGTVTSQRRYVGGEGLGAKIASKPGFVLGEDGDGQYLKAIRRAGASEAFIAHILTTPPDTFWYPDPAELVAEKFVTRLEENDAVPPPPEATSQPALAERLLTEPFWRAIQARFPVNYEAARLALWREVNSGLDFAISDRVERDKAGEVTLGLLPAAPEPMIERSAAFYAEVARMERARGYEGCVTKLRYGEPEHSPDVDRLSAQGDALLVDLIAAGPGAAPPDQARSRKLLTKEMGRLRATGLLEIGAVTDEEGYCRFGHQMFEAAVLLEPKRRIPLLRAMFVLNAVPEAEEDLP